MVCFTTWKTGDNLSFEYYTSQWKKYTGVFVRWENIQKIAVIRIGNRDYRFKRHLMAYGEIV